MSAKSILGVYPYFDEFLKAAKQLRKEGYTDISLFCPTARHELDEVMEYGPSPVRWFTLFGALLGATCGYLMTIWMSNDWAMITGGKPIGSWDLTGAQPYSVPTFELTILLGGLITLISMLVLAGIPNLKAGAYDPRFSDDHFGIEVRTSEDKFTVVEDMMKNSGAKEVSRV